MSRFVLPAATSTAITLALLGSGCSHSQSTAPNYGGAHGAGGEYDAMASDGGSQSMSAAPTMGETSMGTPTSGRMMPTGSPAAAQSPGVTSLQPSNPAPRTWGGQADTPSTDTQYGSSASVGSTTDVSGLSDAQIAAVLEAVHQGEIRQGLLASSRASAFEVKRFAGHMVVAHRNMLGSEMGVLSRAQITPSDNAVSNQLKSDGRAQVSTLQSMRGREFDRAYMDAQVRGHTEALELIDRILPTLRNPELKNDVQASRSRVESHLREAEHLQQDLEAGSTNAQPQSSRGRGAGHDMDGGM
jgi:putative membrane protein